MISFRNFVFSAQHILAALKDQPKPLVAPNKDLLPFGLPITNQENLVYIYRHGYISAFDIEYLVPRWVCWRLYANKINYLNVPRKECFERDNSLQISPMPIQYQNSGFDLGHMCDCEDLSYSVLSQRETFILSNIVPQIPFFNRIIWAKLERETRKQVKETQNDHWVLAASVYDENCSKLQNITIPKLFEKIVVNLQTGNTKCYSFPHESLLDKNLSNFFVSSLTNLLVDI